MEGLHNNAKMAKLNAQLLRGNLENVDLNSPLFRYLCAQSQPQSPIDALKQQRRRHHSPLSPVENLMERSPPSTTIYRTPMRDVQGEEVLVMDGVLVTGGGGRSSRSASDLSSSSSSDSSGMSPYKCQFAHGKEKLRPTRFPVKNKSEAQMCKSYTGTGSYTPSPKFRFAHQVMESSITEAAAATKQAVSLTAHKSTIWTPQDDGIEVVLLHSSPRKPPSTKDIEYYISAVLYGPTTRRRMRLPVFVEICPE